MSKLNPIQIIVTEDLSLFRYALKLALNKYDEICVIGEAENGQKLLELLEILQPDIITLNIQMPIMDGLAALPIIREKYPRIKVLMISMHNDPAMIRRTIELGAHGYLTKEAGSKQIYDAIKKLSELQFLVNRTVAEALLKTENKLYPELPPDLSEIEYNFLRLYCAGHSEEDIGKILVLQPYLVQATLNKLIKMHKVKSKEELFLLCF